MNILRRFKGFTTNSSSAAEWTPPPDLLEPDKPNDADGGTEPSANSATQGAAQPASANSATVEESGRSDTAAASRLNENVTILAGFALAVLGVFVVERLIRRLVRNRRAR